MVRRIGAPALGATVEAPEGSGEDGSPRLLFLEMYPLAYWRVQSYLRFASIGSILFIAALMLFIRYLYKKTMRYKREAEAQKHLARLGEVARTLSHEIKNPLSAIQLQTGILRKTTSQDSPEVKIIEEEVERLNLLVARIGEFLKNPEGRPEVIDADRFVVNLIPRFDGEIAFRREGSDGFLIRFDGERLRSVLENLFRNALESETAEAEVEVLLTSSKKHVEIAVFDRGKGLPQQAEESLFDPFFTTKIRGSGIGLAISKRFVEAAGGSLTLKSREGGGTEAHILLHRERQ
jgi:two-component system sensor histidine kinase HydH